MTSPLITKYRPQTLADVVGQKAVVNSLKTVLETRSTHTFLFIGPSGTGKTTLARIAAAELGCAKPDLLEINAADLTGVEDMRNITSTMLYRPLSGGAKGVLIDECQRLSRNAWDALLKPAEEPPEFAFWFFCTTEPTKVPENIKTRCTRFDLKPVSADALIDLLDAVAVKEKLFDGPQGEKVIDLCALEAGGSPRQALANLAACAGAKTVNEAKELLRTAATSEEAINLARALVKGESWGKLQEILNGLQETNPESVRHVVRAYVSKVVLGAKTEQQAGRGLEILSAFSEPFHQADGIAPLLLACGQAVLGRQ